jgi:thiol-disulfide isomerase/thioredoxin
MKKLGWFLMVVVLLGLTACVGSAVEIPYLENTVDVVEITSEEIAERMDQGIPFLLYVSSVTCTSCLEFRPLLNEYIRNTGLEVLKIESDDAFPTDNEWIAYEFTPTLVLFDGETVVFHINMLDNPKPFSTVEQLTKQLNRYIASK